MSATCPYCLPHDTSWAMHPDEMARYKEAHSRHQTDAFRGAAEPPTDGDRKQSELEWRDYNGRFFVALDETDEETPWTLHKGREGTLGEDTWTLMCGDTILMMCPDIDYLKAKAERLQRVLSGAAEPPSAPAPASPEVR